VPAGVARLAGGRPVVALAGALGPGSEHLHCIGIHAAQSLVPGPMPLEEAMRGAPALLEAAAVRLAHLLEVGRRLRED